jgi:hypothetical protein
MLQQAGGPISDCLARAGAARHRAEETTDPARKADLLAEERRWNRLAESYRFAESLDRFLHRDLATAGDWQPAASAPFARPLELAVVDGDAAHALVFPCCRAADGWIEARTGRFIDVVPTHWREWIELGRSESQPQADGGGDARMGNDYGLVIFENEEASVRVARGDNNLFELVVRVHGEEVTAYDLDDDQIATIGGRLLALATRA